TQASCSNTNGVLKIAGMGGTGPLEYSIDGSNYQSSGIFDALDSGTYVAYTKDANGCINKDTVLLTALPHPVVFIGNDTTLCESENLVLAAPQNPPLTYLWQDNTTAYNYTVRAAGIYYVKVTNGSGCSTADTIDIKYKMVPVFSIGNDTSLCAGNLFNLQPVPQIAGIYLWSTGAVSPFVSVNAPGLYWLQVIDSGCVKRDSITVTSKLNPSVSLGNDTTLCEGITYLLNASYTGATYLWQDGSTSSQFTVTVAGAYHITVDLNGCTARDSVTITYLSKPQFTLGKDTVICQGEGILLQPHINVAVNYLWQDGSTASSYNVKDTGFYSLTVSNTCGSYSDDIKITPGLCSLMLPNAFTPNGDGVNDIFRVKYPFSVRSFIFTIYNRFGERVFETTDMSKGWNGIFQGVDQPVDSYVWVIQLTDINNIPQTGKGVVTLIR
ncbi:MAG: gliding motility-associated C-terminal domain-containing protein, partial [Ginsengibacter sp.]